MYQEGPDTVAIIEQSRALGDCIFCHMQSVRGEPHILQHIASLGGSFFWGGGAVKV